MFFFFENENPILSGMAFESYVINVLQNYLEAQGKTIVIENNLELFDALLPDGINEISEPVHLAIKTGYSNKSGYFRNIERFAFHVCEATTK